MIRRYWFVLPILAVLGVLFATWRGATPITAPVTVTTAGQPRYTLSGARWTRYDEQGQASFAAQAQTIDYYNDESARLHEVELRGLGGIGSPWQIKAPLGIAPAHARRMLLSGPVTAIGRWPEGESVSFVTPELWVDQDSREISTEAAVKLVSASRSADATGLRADWEGKTLELLHDVRVNYVPES
jgi:LPS export ABC transporter protein LptC